MGGNDTCSWDEAKREKVFRERGIDFDELGRFFLDPGALTVEDKRRDYGEPRYNMLGKHQGLVLNITFTLRTGKYHLFSARVASRKERRSYAAHQARHTR